MREAGELERGRGAQANAGCRKGVNGTNMLRKEEKVATIIRLPFCFQKNANVFFVEIHFILISGS